MQLLHSTASILLCLVAGEYIKTCDYLARDLEWILFRRCSARVHSPELRRKQLRVRLQCDVLRQGAANWDNPSWRGSPRFHGPNGRPLCPQRLAVQQFLRPANQCVRTAQRFLDFITHSPVFMCSVKPTRYTSMPRWRSRAFSASVELLPMQLVSTLPVYRSKPKSSFSSTT